MTTGRFNMYLGLVVMILATIVGFALGQSLEQYYKAGYGQIPLWRYLIKAGHTHGMPFGLINIVFGLLIGRSDGSSNIKRVAALSAALALLLPVGVSLRGVTEGAKFAEGIAMVGGFSLLASCVTMFFIVRKQSSGRLP